MTRVVDPAFAGLPLKVSPNGEKFFVVCRRGNLQTNSNEFELKVFGGGKSLEEFVEIGSLKLVSSTNDPAIADAAWSGNDAIAFRGAQEDGGIRRFRWTIGAAHPIAIISPAQLDKEIIDLVTSEEGSTLYATARAEESTVSEITARGSGMVIDPMLTLYDVDAGPWKRNPIPDRFDIWLKRPGAKEPRLMFSGPFAIYPTASPIGTTLSISPNGLYAIAVRLLPEVPSHWTRYRGPTGVQLNRYKRVNDRSILVDPERGRGDGHLHQAVLLDLEAGTSKPLLDGPVGRSGGISVVWVPSRDSVIVSDLMMPVEEAARLGDAFLTHPTIVEINLKTGALHAVARNDDPLRTVTLERWDEGRQTLEFRTLNGPDAGAREWWSPAEDRWVRIQSTAEINSDAELLAEGRYAVEVRQSLNTPPDLYVTDVASGREKRLTFLNPILGSLDLGQVKVFGWTDRRGHRWKAGLAYPTGYRPERRYPLVIQTHGFGQEEFLVDGPGTLHTGFAAQALANRGFLVAQTRVVPEGEGYEWLGSEREGPVEAEMLRSLVYELDRIGMIDPERCAIQGFSRTSYHVKYALAFSGIKFKAAAIADGVDYGYFQFISAAQVGAARLYGEELPIGKGLASYLRSAPTFNTDKINAAIRFEAIGNRAKSEWELYSLLRLRYIPVELFYYPDGDHQLQKPRELLNSQGGNVDWFDFWLNDHEEPDPTKAGQYARWRKLKTLS